MKVTLDDLLNRPLSTTEKMDVQEKAKRVKQLDPIAFEITQNSATERPFTHPYYQEEREGIYVDVVSGKALFSSKDKFDAGCGWPSFSKPIEEASITYDNDYTLSRTRVEIKSYDSESHLGHVFDDGIDPTGLRYCVNGAALKFIPKSHMAQEGYGAYLYLFDETQDETQEGGK